MKFVHFEVFYVQSPMVINISKEAAIAYRDGHLPLNTLANKVLKIYDQQMQAAETNYNRRKTWSARLLFAN